MAPTRGPSADDEAIFKKIRNDFTSRIMAEGCQTEIRGVEKDGDHYTFYVVAQGIQYTVKFELEDDGEVETFTVEKTKKKSSCSIL